eukprot:CAMPEP_0177330206 /NCGR_PEP_ID=MMETSP0368-20130122/20395_1 /TAXON_ID=447022 ORGANISM="Scrippsiella hangoei-like, Strain SHHI-4" /NCGR_SAMPLE_ID=MMETSP0368 /ASSEMBLY_ACC=CAM_ASM_000363 /LENGTH=100 /DNA_ID=CAMNT_0018790509 /DNA_START=599 /DNA_END=899 /DNA_ORIENTATION=-
MVLFLKIKRARPPLCSCGRTRASAHLRDKLLIDVVGALRAIIVTDNVLMHHHDACQLAWHRPGLFQAMIKLAVLHQVLLELATPTAPSKAQALRASFAAE